MFIELSRARVNTDQIVFWTESNLHLGPAGLNEISEDDYKKLNDALLTRPRKTKDVEPKNELNVLFDELHKLTGGKGKAVFSLEREKKLSELLSKHRLTKELLITAAKNIGNDSFLQGDNDRKKRFGDVDYLLRPDKAANWSENKEEQKKKGMFNG